MVNLKESWTPQADVGEQKLSTSVQQFIIVAANTGKNIFFADGGHDAVPPYLDKLLVDPVLLSKLSESGYHAYFREADVGIQGLVDDLARNKISPKEFADKVSEGRISYDVAASHSELSTGVSGKTYLTEIVAPLIQQMQKYGISTIAADVEMNNNNNDFSYLIKEYAKITGASPEELKDLTDRYHAVEEIERNGQKIKVASLDHLDVRNELISKVFPNGEPPHFRRMQRDGEVAGHINEKMADFGAEKVIGTFGAAHSFHRNAIQETLKGETLIVLVLPEISRLPSIKEDFKKFAGEDFGASSRAPQFIIDASTGSVYPTHTADAKLIKELGGTAERTYPLSTEPKQHLPLPSK